MDKEKALPLALRDDHFSLPAFDRHAGAKIQRDADWERVKPLVEAVQRLSAHFPPIEHHANGKRTWLSPAGSMVDAEFVLALREALAQMGVD